MNNALFQLAEQLGQTLQAANKKIATAESCTGGGIAYCITDIAGSSAWFERGFVTYSNAAKVELLGVNETTLKSYGAVSAQTAREMATGALARSEADIAVAVTGIAGPDGGTLAKPVGTVFIAWANRRGDCEVAEKHFIGDRQQVRAQTIQSALQYFLSRCTKNPVLQGGDG